MQIIQFLIGNYWLRILTYFILSFFLYLALSQVLGLVGFPRTIYPWTPALIAATLLVYSLSNTPDLKKFFFLETNSLKLSLLSIALVVANFALIILFAIGFGAKYSVDFNAFSLTGAFNFLLQTMITAANEELVFRGVLFLSLIFLLGNAKAVVFTSIIFAGVHLANPNISTAGVVNIFIAGVAFSSIALITKSLFPVFVFHFFWNFLEYMAIGSPVSGVTFPTQPIGHLELTNLGETTKFFTGGYFGIEEGFITTILLIVNIYFFKFVTDKFNLIAVESNSALLRSKIIYSEQFNKI